MPNPPLGPPSPKVRATPRTCPVHAVLGKAALTEPAYSLKNAWERALFEPEGKALMPKTEQKRATWRALFDIAQKQ